jgi:tetratricopeptide (TPR) repeat protein
MSDIALSPEEQATIDELYALSDEGTHYEILGVAPDADRETIQEAFYDLSRQWHPDRFFRKDLGDYEEPLEAVFVAITDAWRTLGSEAGRYTYDLENRSRIEERHQPRPAQAPPAPRAASGPSTSATRPSRARPPTRRRKAPPRQPGTDARRAKALEEVRKQVAERIQKAKRHYKEALVHREAGRVLKANASIQLARTFHPKNATIGKLADELNLEARKVQSRGFVAAAESADSFANYREALANYRKAVEYGTEHPRAHYRLGLLTRRVDDDRREALKHMRNAIKLEPNSIEFRMGLGELYEELGLTVNARAQYKRVLDIDKHHLKAKERVKTLK